MKFYKGRDNFISVKFQKDGVSLPIADIIKLEVVLSGGNKIDSIQNPNLFVFGTNDVKLMFGGLNVPDGLYQMTLIIYLSTSIGGIVWGQPTNIWIYTV